MPAHMNQDTPASYSSTPTPLASDMSVAPDFGHGPGNGHGFHPESAPRAHLISNMSPAAMMMGMSGGGLAHGLVRTHSECVLFCTHTHTHTRTHTHTHTHVCVCVCVCVRVCCANLYAHVLFYHHSAPPYACTPIHAHVPSPSICARSCNVSYVLGVANGLVTGHTVYSDVAAYPSPAFVPDAELESWVYQVHALQCLFSHCGHIAGRHFIHIVVRLSELPETRRA